MAIIETTALTRHYAGRRGIESVNLSVPEGCLYGFLGPNGAGKTTTIRILIGLLRAAAGDARIFGRDCWSDGPDIRQEVGYLPGDLRLYPWMTGREALRIVAATRRRDLAAEGMRLAEELGLDMRVRVRRMSRGMRQKLGLILALAHRPRLLILDEPTASLDPLMQDRLHERLRRMCADGHTVFFSSHTLSEVEQLCDRVGMIRCGRLIRDESLDSLRTQAGYHVTIRWDASVRADELDAPSFLEIETRDERIWQGQLRGDVNELLRWLAQFSVSDLLIQRPELETVFRHLYDEGTDVA